MQSRETGFVSKEGDSNMSPFGIKEAINHPISLQAETVGLQGVDLQVLFFCVRCAYRCGDNNLNVERRRVVFATCGGIFLMGERRD